MKNSISTLLFVLFCSPLLAQELLLPEDAPKGEWLPLFNGENLDGWVAKITGYPLGVNYKNTFRVEDGMLVVNYDEYEEFDGEFGHLFFKQEFSHYIIRAEYRFIGEQLKNGVPWGLLNNGIMIHSQAPESMALDQQFPVSIEVKLYAAPGYTSGEVCSPGTDVKINGEYTHRHCIDTSNFSHGLNEWVTIEAEVHGGEWIQHRQNGIVTAEYEQPKLDPEDPNQERLIARQLLEAGADEMLSKGYIAIQSETHPTQFRKIEIMLLEE